MATAKRFILLFLFANLSLTLSAQRNLLPIYLEVQQLLDYRNFHDAEKIIRNARKRYSKNDSIEALWGKLQYVQDDTARALSIWRNALKQNPKSAAVNEQLVSYYVNKNDCKRALNCIDKILKHKNPPVRFYYFKGILLYDLSNANDAKIYFERAITFEEGAIANYYLAIVYINEKNFEAAKRYLTFGMREYPEMGELYYYRGLCNNELGDTAAAQTDWEKAREFGYQYSIFNIINGCGNKPLGIDTTVLAQYVSIEEKLGKKTLPLLQLEFSTHFASKQYESALITMNKMMALSPRNDNFYISKGGLFLSMMEYDSALVSFKKSTIINPKNKTGYYNQALCYMQMEHYDSALSYVSYLFVNYPIYAPAYSLAGDILLFQKRPIEAFKLYSKAISVDEEYAEAYYKRSFLLEAYGVEFGALTDLTKAIYHAPDRVNYRLRRAAFYMEMSKGSNAYKDLEYVRLHYPNDSRGIFAMADYLTYKKDYKDAIKEYEKGFKFLHRINSDSMELMKSTIRLRVYSLFPYGGLKQHEYVKEQAEIIIKDIEEEEHYVYLELMKFYYRSKQWEEALKYAEYHRKITDVENIDKSYFYNRARIKYKLGDKIGYCRDFEKAGYRYSHEPPYYCPKY